MKILDWLWSALTGRNACQSEIDDAQSRLDAAKAAIRSGIAPQDFYVMKLMEAEDDLRRLTRG